MIQRATFGKAVDEDAIQGSVPNLASGSSDKTLSLWIVCDDVVPQACVVSFGAHGKRDPIDNVSPVSSASAQRAAVVWSH